MILLRFLLALLVLLPLPAAAQPSFPKLTGRVVDAANLLSPEQEAQLTGLSAEVEQASSRQFVIATIPDLEGYDIADYGYQLGRAWGIGQKGASNGIILIVAPKDRKVRIEVGYGLEPIMTDALSNQIVAGIILSRFRAGDMAGGIMAGAQAIAEQMKLPLEAAEQKAKQAQDTASATRGRKDPQGGGLPIGLIFGGIVLVVVVVSVLGAGLGRRRRAGPWGSPQGYRGDDSGALPILLWTIASEIGREMGRHHDGGGGGSDWGGGDGGGFSGGGGSFGGGGASGSW